MIKPATVVAWHRNGREFRDRIDGLGLLHIPRAFRSPWQNGFAERWIGSLRRDCLDHVIPINERQLRRVIRILTL